MSLENRLRDHLHTAADLAAAAPAPRKRTASPRPASAPSPATTGARLFGPRWPVLPIAATAAVLALASGLLVAMRIDKPRSTLVHAASTSSHPGLVLGTIPAGFDNGVRIELADPQNLAAPTESSVMQYRQRNGPGRLSVTTTDDLGPLASATSMTVHGERIPVLESTSADASAYLMASVKVGSRKAWLLASGIDVPTLARFATALVEHGPRVVVPKNGLPSGWESRLQPTPSADLSGMAEYRGPAGKIITVNRPPRAGDEWTPMGPRPDQKGRTVRDGDGTTFNVFPTAESNGGYWSAISKDWSRFVSGEASGVTPELVLGSLHAASVKEWAALSVAPAYAVGSIVAPGDILAEGVIGEQRWRTVCQTRLQSPLSSFTTGLVGVPGASETVSAGESSQDPIVLNRRPGITVARVATALHPTRATLRLDGRKAITASFLPAVDTQSYRYAFFPGVQTPMSGTYRIEFQHAGTPPVTRSVNN